MNNFTLLEGERVWLAPAKLNLMLRIVGRRSDGYHQLQTVFQFLDRCDRLRFRVRQDGKIRRLYDFQEVSTEHDLVLRAARLLQQQSGVAAGVEVELDKRLPLGAGLGGGSSDAATTLVALNRLWETGFSSDQLAHLGLQLGADVPVFVHGFAAWGEGVGDELTPIDLPEECYLVVLPPCHVSTAEVFSDSDLTRDSSRIKIADFLAGSRGNDCVHLVTKRYPAVATAMEWLGRYGEPRLTGTGAALFVTFPDRQSAERVLAQLPEDLTGFVAFGLNRSPLFAAVDAEQKQLGRRQEVSTPSTQ